MTPIKIYNIGSLPDFSYFQNIQKFWIMDISEFDYQQLLNENEKLKSQLSEQINPNTFLDSITQSLLQNSNNDVFKLIFRTAKIGLAFVDSHGQFIESNPRLSEITGYSKEELSKINFTQITHPNDIPLDRKFLAECLAGKIDTFSVEKRYIHKSGNIVWVNLNVNIIRDENGNFKYAVSATEDITEQKNLKQVEEIIHSFNYQFNTLSIDDLLAKGLEIAEKLTDSKFGFFQFVDEIHPELDFKIWSKNSYKNIDIHALPLNFNFLSRSMLLDGINKKNDLIYNNYQGFVRENGWDEELLIADRIMFSGTVENGKLVSYIGVANKSTDYNELNYNALNTIQTSISAFIGRKTAEEKLNESENNFRTFFNSIDDFLFVLNHQGFVLEVNQTIIKYLGYTRLELVGKPALNLYHEEHQIVAQEIISFLLNQKMKKCTLPLCTKDGRLIPVETHVSMGKWDNQDVYYFQNKDLSKLRYSEDKFSKVFHINPAICAIIDLKTETFIELNKTFYSKLKYKPNQVIGIKPAKLLKIDNLAMEQIDAEFQETGRLNNFNINLKANNGDSIPVLLSGEIIALEGKKYVYAVAVDISDRKATEEKLIVNQHQLQEAQEIAQMGHYAFNIETGYWTNSSSLDLIFGIDHEYVRSVLGWLNIIHPDFRTEMTNYLQEQILTNHLQFDKEYKIVSIKDAQEKWVHGKGLLKFNNAGKLVEMIGTIQDITTRKNAEIKLEESENALRKIIESTIGKGGQDFFDHMALSLQQITKSDYTYIAEYKNNSEVQTVSFFCNGQKIDNVNYLIKETPCEQVFNNQSQIYKEHVSQIFPNDKLLSNLDIEAYAGTPILDDGGNAIGIIVSLFGNPIKNAAFIRSIFEVCSTSIGSEMQRSKSELKGKENELTLHAVFDNAPVMMVLLDENAEILSLNKAGQNIYNYDNANILGKRTNGLMNCFKELEDLPSCGNLAECKDCLLRFTFLNTLMTGEPTLKIEKEFITNQGDKEFTYTFLLSSSRVELDGKFKVLISLDDITDRKRMEQKILQNEYTLNKIFDSAPVIMLLLDENATIVKLNKIGSDLYTPLVNKSSFLHCGDILQCAGSAGKNDNPIDNVLCHNCIIQTAVEETLQYSKEVYKKEADIISIKNKEMILRTFLISSSLIESYNQKRVLLTLDEITDRKKVDEELILSKEKAVYNEQRYRLLSNITFEGIMLYKETIIVDVNRALSMMSGYTYDELIGQRSMSFLFPPEYKSFFEQKLTEEYSLPYETVLICKNGTRIPVEIESRYFSHNNERIRVSAVRDITERKQGEKKILQAIVQTEENERARFAQELHDGLGPILSNVQMYFQWLAEADDNTQFVIDKGNVSLKNAFSTLREISNNLSPHILHNFGIAHAMNNFFETIAVKNIQIDFKTNIEKKRFDSNIEIALYRVLTELINNSIKYSNAHKIEIDMQLENNLLQTKYHDNGKGFDIKNTLKSSKGVGMINIQNRIKAIQGNISFSSAIDEGFTVEINVGL